VNIVSWWDEDEASHKAKTKASYDLGYRTLSLSIHGDPAAPRYAAVMVKRDGAPIDTEQHDNLSLADIQAKLNAALTGAAKFPVIVSATGAGANARFAAVFIPLPPGVLTVGAVEMTQAQFAALNDLGHTNGTIVWWHEVYGTASDPRYAAVWAQNLVPENWSTLSQAVGKTTPLPEQEVTANVQARFNALVAGRVRTHRVAPTPAGGHLMTFTDSGIGPWEARGDLTVAKLKQHAEEKAAKGLMPLQVTSCGQGTATRFAAVWTKADLPMERKFRSLGKTAAIPAIDAKAEAFMRDHDLRGFQLAVVKGARLVYARGYTLAEVAPTYPDITDETRFRLASCSKLYVAATIHMLFQQGKLTRDTYLLDVLKLGGSSPPAMLNQVKIKHLLESNSGLNQGLIDPPGPGPFTAQTIFDAIGKSQLGYTPGSDTGCVYGNLDYWLLSQVAAKVAGAPSFEAALKALVLDPLQMSRTRESRTLVESQLGDEAPYHYGRFEPNNPGWSFLPFGTAASCKHADGRLVPFHYGRYDLELIDGSGGLSASVVDLARLAAMFVARKGNGVFQEATINAWLNDAFQANKRLGAVPKAHGWHGFDWMVQASNGTDYLGAKGGFLPGAESAFGLWTGDVSLIAVKSSNGRAGATVDWYGPIYQAASAIDWTGVDRFKTYGMTPFVSPFSSAKATKPKPNGPFDAKQAQTSLKLLGQPPKTRVRRNGST
jgi:CubicO group peptidase (beta-lactamase class C family)